MTAQLIANIGISMMQVHDAITWSLQVTKSKCQEFSQPAAELDQKMRESFILYVSTMGMVINAHHLSEDHVVFPRLQITLTQVPFKGLSADHKVIDLILAKLRQIVAAPAVDFFSDLLDTVTQLIDLWMPHIAKEKQYIYSPEITAAFMSPEEQGKMLQDTSRYALEQGNPALIVPFIMYNLEPAQRAAFTSFLPPEMTEKLVPAIWKPQWEPMMPFFLG